MKTRLEKMCEALGWQGGTIWQIMDELTARGFLMGCDILEISEASFDILLEQVKEAKARK